MRIGRMIADGYFPQATALSLVYLICEHPCQSASASSTQTASDCFRPALASEDPDTVVHRQDEDLAVT